MKISAPKGTKDILPPESSNWQWAEQIFAETCSKFAYREIRIPTFEQTELFSRGVGDTTDIVQKEMYTFLDKGKRSMTLRPEGTAGVVRSYLENGMSSWPSPVRLYYNITAFRYENVQKGRYREFHQFGCEAFGSDGPLIDAEQISLLAMFFQTLGLRHTTLRINSIGCPDCRPIYNENLRRWLQPHVADLCPTCQDRFERNPLRILDCKEAKCQDITAAAPAQLDNLCPKCEQHFTGLKYALDYFGQQYFVDKRIVRGLDYYTKTVFEFISENVGTQGTICGGGRYDGLVEATGGPATPAIGFALGVERLLLELQAQGVGFPKSINSDIFIAVAGDFSSFAARICHQLRQVGVKAETDLLGRSLKAQMKYAGKTGIRYVLVLGEDEIKNNSAGLRRLSDGHEQVVSLQDLTQMISCLQEN